MVVAAHMGGLIELRHFRLLLLLKIGSALLADKVLLIAFLIDHQIIKVPLWVDGIVPKQITVREDIRNSVDECPSHFNHLGSLDYLVAVLNF